MKKGYHMKHRTLTTRLAVLLCLFALLIVTLTACGGASSASGTHGALQWSYSKSDRTLTVSGTGAMDDLADADSAPWRSIRDAVTTVVVVEGVTSVGDYAFYYLPALTTVHLPTTLTEVGDHAFAFCSALTIVSIPEQVSAIGAGAFEGCGALSSIYLPPSVTQVGESAFAFCYSMKSFMATAPDIRVGKEAFLNCRSLGKLTFRSTVTEAMIAKDAFAGTELTFADIVTTDTILGSTTLTIRYLLNDEEVDRYEETFGYGVTYSVKTPVREGYTPNLRTISGSADGIDREETVIYTKTPPEEAPKTAISFASILGVGVMVVVLIAIGVAVFFMIRPSKSEKSDASEEPAKARKRTKDK